MALRDRRALRPEAVMPHCPCGKRGGGTHLTTAVWAYIGQFQAYIAGLKDLADRQFREAFGEE